MTPLDKLHFVFVTGKGGVGKTTVSAVVAQTLAARGLRVLLALSGAKERISALFGVDAIGTEVRVIASPGKKMMCGALKSCFKAAGWRSNRPRMGLFIRLPPERRL